MAPATEPSRAPGPTVRLALVHPMRTWVDALEVLLETRHDIELVTAHTDLAWGRHAVVNGRADVLLMHVESGDPTVGSVLRDLFDAAGHLAVVVLSSSRDPHLLASAVRAGVRGWVDPSSSFDQLLRVLKGVARGESWLPPDVMSLVLDSLVQVAQTRESTAAVFASLTTRELDILRCLTEGLTRQQIADKYFLSPHTVRTHINHVLHKLDVHSTLAAVSLARRVGLADQQPGHHEP